MKKTAQVKTDKTKVIKTDDSTILRNQLARALADYDNLQKRVERERNEIVKLSNLGLLVRLLPVVDMFEGAEEHLKDSGLAIAINELLGILKEDGIEKIQVANGQKFDENIHEAIEVIDTADGEKEKAGTIAEVVMSGWKYSDGTIIRHVRVKVYKK